MNFTARIIEQFRKTPEQASKRRSPWPKTVCLVTGAPRSVTTAVTDWLRIFKKAAVFHEERICLAADDFLKRVHHSRRLFERRGDLEPLLRNLVFRYCRRVTPLSGKVLIFKENLSLHMKNFPDDMEILFPGLKVLFMVRHPVPTVNSMVKRQWNSTVRNVPVRSMPLTEAIETWRYAAAEYIRHAEKPNYHLCRVEDLLADPEEESRKIREFLGLRRRSRFARRKTKKIDLGADMVREILDRTRPEREFLGYGEVP